MTSRKLEAILQPMSIEDLEACWVLDQLCFPPCEAYDRDMVRYLLTHQGRVSYKIINSLEKMLGFAIGLVEDDETGHIISIAISPEARSRGYGRWLMQRLEDGFRLRNVMSIHLEVRTTNKHAIHLYTKLSFFIVERLKQYYADGGDAYLMVKSLIDLSPEDTEDTEDTKF
jgi:ribosomal-protein-alanine N-acetyltransferase